MGTLSDNGFSARLRRVETEKHFLVLFFFSEELHAIASTKKLSSKNKALWQVRHYRREPQADGGGSNFQQNSEVGIGAHYY